MPTIDDVRNMLQAGHRKDNDTAEETLNRLWVKHVKSRTSQYGEKFVQAVPLHLNNENVIVSLEKWPTEKLGKLIQNDRTRPLSGDENLPVVVVKFRDQDCLIDGGRRITKWRRQNVPKIHNVYVLKIRN